MKIHIGDRLDNIILPSLNGSIFELKSTIGKKLLLTFYRFAACPMCNLRINDLKKNYDSFGSNFIHVAIFNSDLNNLKRFTKKHDAPFPILADQNFEYFQKYSVKRSLPRFLWSQIIRIDRQVKGIIKGYIPWTFKGHITTLPVDVLIDENGVVQIVKYAKDLGDHISIATIKQFTNN